MKSSVKAESAVAKKPLQLFLSRAKIVEIISALFILLFLYTAVSKSFEIFSTIIVLKKIPAFSTVASEIAWAVVVIEYITSALLFFPKTRKLGLYVSFGLMISFTAYIGYMMAFIPDLPCSCGGVISKMSWTQHLFFNIFFALLSFVGIRLCRKKDHDHPSQHERNIVFT